METIWFDFTNPPHVNFFLPIINYYKNREFGIKLTAREFVETVKLLELNNLNFKIYGKHGGKNKLLKITSLILRELKLISSVNGFDFSISSNYEAPLASWIKRKPSIVFDDNDISPNWLYSKFAKYVISPCYIDKDAMYNMGIRKDQLITYTGFKENVYIADFNPSPTFLDQLPFKDFVTVRPENIQASYVPNGRQSIVPDLISSLNNKGYNVLYLPRYPGDKLYIKQSDRIFIPDNPLNGLDVCYYSKAVLTGAGTFSREAALLGTPAISFFAGDRFLGVDRYMIDKKMVFYSRDVKEILDFVTRSEKKEFDPITSKTVQLELFEILDKIINNPN